MKKSLGQDRYPSGRKRPPSRTIATSSGVNRAFHKKGLSYSPGIRGKFKKYRALRGLKQIDFASLALWSEMRCKKYLEAKGFFGVQWGRQCWRCQASLNQQQQDPALLRCSNRSCPALRPRILVWFHFFRSIANDIRMLTESAICAFFTCGRSCVQVSIGNLATHPS